MKRCSHLIKCNYYFINVSVTVLKVTRAGIIIIMILLLRQVVGLIMIILLLRQVEGLIIILLLRQVVGFSAAYDFDTACFLTSVPRELPRWLAIVMPFSATVWLTLAGQGRTSQCHCLWQCGR